MCFLCTIGINKMKLRPITIPKEVATRICGDRETPGDRIANAIFYYSVIVTQEGPDAAADFLRECKTSSLDPAGIRVMDLILTEIAKQKRTEELKELSSEQMMQVREFAHYIFRLDFYKRLRDKGNKDKSRLECLRLKSYEDEEVEKMLDELLIMIGLNNFSMESLRGPMNLLLGLVQTNMPRVEGEELEARKILVNRLRNSLDDFLKWKQKRVTQD